MLNEQSYQLYSHAWTHFTRPDVGPRLICRQVGRGWLLDAGVETLGSVEAGLWLARLCLGGAADVTMVPADPERHASDVGVLVRTDDPLRACLGSQYAGWPIQTDDYFAMGSGPMRMFRGREELLEQLGLSESGGRVVGVLESDRPPGPDVIERVAAECNVRPEGVHLAIAPSTSLAGSVQVVARSVETALHKLHALRFDVTSVVSAAGVAPVPPPARSGDTVGGIGRTNDAILYGGRVTLWVDADDPSIDAVAERVPSGSSSDHGRPFADIFKDYEHDFYRVDPLLFSPAVVTFHSLRSGRSWSAGRLETDVLRTSFGR